MKFLMTCQCILENPAPIQGPKWKRRICPEHGGTIDKRITSCVDCGTEIRFSAAGAIPKRCPDCLKEQLRLKAKRYYKAPPERPKNRPVTAVFKCGCRVPRERCKFRIIEGRSLMVCVKHKAPLDHREAPCVTCGKPVIATGSNGFKWECPACQPGKPRKKEKKRVSIAPLIQASVRRSDCQWRDNCLSRAMLFGLDCPGCFGCSRYLPEIVDYDLATRGGYDPCEYAVGVI
jgi:hypothetical protein